MEGCRDSDEPRTIMVESSHFVFRVGVELVEPNFTECQYEAYGCTRSVASCPVVLQR
jgi:hypothetical protein